MKCSHGHGERSPGILAIRQGILAFAKQRAKERVELERKSFTGGLGIRDYQAIIDEHLDVLTVEADAPIESRVRLQTLASGQRGSRGLRQTILVVSLQHRLTIVAETQTTVGVIHAVIALMSDQHHSRTRVHMTVIGDIHQQLFTDLVLDPAVKNRDQCFELDSLGVGEEELYIDVLKFHETATLFIPGTA